MIGAKTAIAGSTIIGDDCLIGGGCGIVDNIKVENTLSDDGTYTDKIKKFSGTVSNNLPYAEPVCFGENLPPSWGDVYRTRQNTQAGYPELIAKELQTWAEGEYTKIKGAI